jgi:peptide/nickel transport system ATP-binding protein
MTADDLTLTRPATSAPPSPAALAGPAAPAAQAGPAAPTPAIAVDALSVGYAGGGRIVPTVLEASFEVPAGSTTALVGESGSGKTTIASAISGLLPENARLLTGGVRLLGQDVSRLGERGWRTVRSGILGYVPQDPLGSLDPLQTVGGHVAASVRRARGVSEREARVIAQELLETVHIADAARRLEAHPHELSGGQLQRVLIAGALAGDPDVLIADEPTSALDVTVQQRVLDLLAELREQLSLSVLLITHDLSLAEERSDRVVVLQQGRVVEQGGAAEVIARPEAPYTLRLFQDVPAMTPRKHAAPQAELRARRDAAGAGPAVRATGVSKSFDGASRVLEDVDLTVQQGEIHALVGESGSGKTTLARIIAGLTSFDAGTIDVGGTPRPRVPAVVNPEPSALQLVHQNPLAALDPRWRVVDLVAEPLRIAGTARAEARSRARDLLARMGIPEEAGARRIAQLSGGQRQRVSIARALVLSPSTLVLDEPTSALDVTVQARIIELLFALRAADPALTMVFISHDLSLVRQISDTVTVLQRGRVVDRGPVEEVFAAPSSPYTRRLIDAIPEAPQVRR